MPSVNPITRPTIVGRTLLAAACSMLLVVGAAGAVLAEEPLRLDGRITDTTGALDGRHAEIEAALAELNRDGVDLFVLFVNTTLPRTASDYAFEVAELNSLGVNDALLLVAMQDRTDYIWLSDGLEEISDSELNSVIGVELEPRLGDGDFAGAVIAAANGLGEAVAPAPPPQPGASGGLSFAPVLGVLLLLAGVFLVGRWVIGWRTRRGEAEERDRRTGELAKRANQLLLEADDATNEAQQELGFAEAQFAPQEVKPFRDAANQAKAEAAAAFAIRQRLDDATPEDPQTREQLLNEMVQRAQRALDLLAAQRERAAQILALERAAPELLAAMPARLEALAASATEGEARLARLARFADSTTAPVAGNLVEVEKRLAAARQGLEGGTQAAASDDKQLAGRAARMGHEALLEAEQLLAAIEHVEDSVTATAERLPAEIQEAERSVEAARGALGRHQPATPDQSARLGRAEQSLQQARALAAGERPDPLAAERLAGEADKISDELLAAANAEAERHARAAATARGALASAESTYTQALDYVTSRRNAMGRRARTRLVEAERHLAEARVLVDSDPVTAAQAARRAETMAREAFQYGQSDLHQLDPFGGSRGGGGSDLPAIILGGIIGGMLSGGGRSGGSGAGWGGSPWGRSGGRSGGFGGGFGGGRGSGGGFNMPRMPGPGRGGGGRW